MSKELVTDVASAPGTFKDTDVGGCEVCKISVAGKREGEASCSQLSKRIRGDLVPVEEDKENASEHVSN